MMREPTDLQAVVEQRMNQKPDSFPKCNCNHIYKVGNEREGVGNWITIAVIVIVVVITLIHH
jgi:hypothetical protein